MITLRIFSLHTQTFLEPRERLHNNSHHNRTNIVLLP